MNFLGLGNTVMGGRITPEIQLEKATPIIVKEPKITRLQKIFNKTKSLFVINK